MTMAGGDAVTGEAIADSYTGFLGPWKEVYAAFLQARGLQLRPGITLDDVANLLAAIVDGLADGMTIEQAVHAKAYGQASAG